MDPGNIVHANDTNGLLVITQIQPINRRDGQIDQAIHAVQRQVMAPAKHCRSCVARKADVVRGKLHPSIASASKD